MDKTDIDYMQQVNESDLKSQLQEVLSGIIATLDIYEVVDNGDTYDIVNLKNNEILCEEIHLNIVANIDELLAALQPLPIRYVLWLSI